MTDMVGYIWTSLLILLCLVCMWVWADNPGKSDEEIARDLANEQYATYQTAIAIDERAIACYALDRAVQFAINTHDIEYAKGIKGTYEMNCKD